MIARRWVVAVVALTVALLLMFGVAWRFGWTTLVDEAACREFMSRPGPWWAGALGVGLLTADSLLPVVSSAVMFMHGKLFGVAAGTALSVAGCLGAGWAGWGLGRAGGRWLIGPDRAAARRLVEQWGLLAVVATRPMPIIAESVAIMAGAAGLGFGRLTAGVVVGSLPPAALYAWAGATARDWTSGLAIFLIVLVAAGACWMAGQWWARRAAKNSASAA